MAETTVTAIPDNLDTVTHFINEQLKLADCPKELAAQIDLVVEEVFVNIANYAYHPKAGQATVCCETGGNPLQVTIKFTDSGTPYNPLKNADPNINASVRERKIGGLGIFMVKNLADDISYEFKDGKNVLTIHKICRPHSNPA